MKEKCPKGREPDFRFPQKNEIKSIYRGQERFTPKIKGVNPHDLDLEEIKV